MKNLILIMTALVLSACGKNINRAPNSPIPYPPGNGGVVVVVPPSNVNSGLLTLSFSNHGDGGYEDVNEVPVESRMILSLPLNINEVSFSTDDGSVPDIRVTINGHNVCTYRFTGGQYTALNTCDDTVQLEENDVISASGIPENQHANLQAGFTKN